MQSSHKLEYVMLIVLSKDSRSPEGDDFPRATLTGGTKINSQIIKSHKMLGFFMSVLPLLPMVHMPLSVFEFIEDATPLVSHLESAGCDDASNVPWSHPELGIHARNPEHFCPRITLRHRSCCRPNLPKNINYRFIVDNGNDVIATRDFQNHALMKKLTFNKRPVVWLVPGMLADDFVMSEAMELAEAYVRRGFTVLLVDWDEIEKGFGQAVADTRVIAAMLASMILKSGTINRSMCIGFSFGAHVCGMASKLTRKKSGKKIPRCHMLDPAGPGFELIRDTSSRMTHGDCEVMTAVHTSRTTMSNYPLSVIHNNGFGTLERLADCNFVVNGAIAYNQPGCADLCKLNQMIRRQNRRPFIQRGPPAQRCGHARALSLFLSSLEQSCSINGHGLLHSKNMRFPPFDNCQKGGLPLIFNVNTTMALRPYC